MDGQLDFVTRGSEGGFVNVIFQQTNGIFSTGIEFATGSPASAAKAGDFNRDGWPDIVVAHSEGWISILTNDPAAASQDLRYGVGTQFVLTNAAPSPSQLYRLRR
jgi:hypothetical protein